MALVIPFIFTLTLQFIKMNDVLQEIKNQIDDGGKQNLLNSLQQLGQIRTDEYQSATLDKKQIGQVLTSIKHNLDKNKESLGPQTPMIQNEFNKFVSKLPPTIRNDNSSKINQVSKDFRKAKQSNIKTIIQQQDTIDQLKNTLVKSIQKKDIFNITNPFPKIVQIRGNQSTIQQSLAPYERILSMKVPNEVTIAEAPLSVQYLSQYANSQGYNAYGSITGSNGVCFIGTQQIKQGDTSVTVKYPKNQIEYPHVPNLPIKIQYYANKTINSWNNFVSDEAKMLGFMNKIAGSAENRVRYIQNSIVYLNNQNFCAEILATLSYYYLYMPMFRYMKNASVLGVSKESFFLNYPPAEKRADNPLLLKTDVCVQVGKALIDDEKLPQQLYKQIWEKIKSSKNQVNKAAFQKVGSYLENRVAQAQTYFKTAGIPKQSYATTLTNKRFRVKTRKGLVSDQYVNNQLVQIIDKVNGQQKSSVQQDKWDLRWSSKQIYAWDYIFKNQ